MTSTIRRLAASFHGSASAKAAEVAREVRHYAGTCWTRDRALGGPYPDSPRRRALFDIFDADPNPPSGWRRLYDIIVAEIAADHGGRFAACAHGGGAKAVIELPVAEAASAAVR